MPRRLGSTTSLLAAATLLVACSDSGSASRHPPKIAFGETTYDFGRADQGTTVRHTFGFRNLGELDLSIDNVRAGCDCTAAVSSDRVIPPSRDGTIDVTFDTTNDSGRKTRSVSVYSNDPAQPVVTLALIGEIYATVAADPPQLYVGKLKPGQTARNDVRLLVTDAATVTLGPIEVRGKTVDATWREAAPRESGKRLQVAINPGAAPGPFTETLVVHTTGARRPTVTIPVTGIVVNEPDVPPARGQPARP